MLFVILNLTPAPASRLPEFTLQNTASQNGSNRKSEHLPDGRRAGYLLCQHHDQLAQLGMAMEEVFRSVQRLEHTFN